MFFFSGEDISSKWSERFWHNYNTRREGQGLYIFFQLLYFTELFTYNSICSKAGVAQQHSYYLRMTDSRGKIFFLDAARKGNMAR